MKKLLIVFLLLLTFTACGKKQRADTLHNSQTGVDISIGMTKEYIDGEFGESIEKDGYYYYPDGGVSVRYNEGKAVMLTVSSSAWKTIGGLYEGAEREIVAQTFGAGGDSLILQFDKNGEVTSDKDKAIAALCISSIDGYIDSIVVMGAG